MPRTFKQVSIKQKNLKYETSIHLKLLLNTFLKASINKCKEKQSSFILFSLPLILSAKTHRFKLKIDQTMEIIKLHSTSLKAKHINQK